MIFYYILAHNKCTARLGDVQAMQKPLASKLLAVAIEKYQQIFTGQGDNSEEKTDAVSEAEAAKRQLNTLFTIA
jgi:hypothetical protein